MEVTIISSTANPHNRNRRDAGGGKSSHFGLLSEFVNPPQEIIHVLEQNSVLPRSLADTL
jgi:hypothetical protein